MVSSWIANREQIFWDSYNFPDCPVHILAKAMVEVTDEDARDFLFRAMLHLNDYLCEDDGLDWYC